MHVRYRESQLHVFDSPSTVELHSNRQQDAAHRFDEAVAKCQAGKASELQVPFAFLWNHSFRSFRQQLIQLALGTVKLVSSTGFIMMDLLRKLQGFLLSPSTPSFPAVSTVMSHDSFQERCQLRRSRGDAPCFENFEEAEVHQVLMPVVLGKNKPFDHL